jgi:membrane fusion protein, multidrug efflux system
MLFRQEGAQVGVVGADSIVHLRPISIGRDYGTSLEVLQGVQETDRIIINPSDSLQEGQKVNIASNSAPGQEEGQKQ